MGICYSKGLSTFIENYMNSRLFFVAEVVVRGSVASIKLHMSIITVDVTLGTNSIKWFYIGFQESNREAWRLHGIVK